MAAITAIKFRLLHSDFYTGSPTISKIRGLSPASATPRLESNLKAKPMTNARELLFDLEALLNEAQPRSILWLGEPQAAVLESYLAHCKLLNIEIEVAHFPHHELGELQHLQRRFDLGIALDIFPYLDKPVGVQLISRLRDLMCQQFCLNISTSELDESYDWHLTDLIGLGLRKVADYPASNTSLFKYSIDSYKRTPDWLNADNWANPELWGKYRW